MNTRLQTERASARLDRARNRGGEQLEQAQHNTRGIFRGDGEEYGELWGTKA